MSTTPVTRMLAELSNGRTPIVMAAERWLTMQFGKLGGDDALLEIQLSVAPWPQVHTLWLRRRGAQTVAAARLNPRGAYEAQIDRKLQEWARRYRPAIPKEAGK